MYSGIDEMLDKIEAALARDNGAADAARDIVLAGHTFDARIGEVIQELGI